MAHYLMNYHVTAPNGAIRAYNRLALMGVFPWQP